MSDARDVGRTETLESDGPRRVRGGPTAPGVLEVHPRLGPVHAVRGELIIGRDPTCTIALDDAGASRRHAAIVSRGELRLRDLESRNGTWADGERVVGERTIAAGTVVRIGRSLLLVVPDALALRGTGTSTCPPPFVGGTRLAAVLRELVAAARAGGPILIEGESGTGKELAAHFVHTESGRRGELVALNCSAVPPQLVESELFGHTKGAFSGADRARAGLVRHADRGTLFLDEIGELPLDTQAKLLRVLEEGTVRSVGEDRPVPVTLHVVAATHRPLEALVADGRFRNDLFHRLAVHRVGLPALRERPEDIPLFARTFLSASPMTLGVDAMERLLAHPWPGNVRELRNTLHAASTRARGDGRGEIHAGDLRLGSTSRVSPPPLQPEPTTRDEDTEEERTRMLALLASHGGNVSAAARALGVRRAGLYERLWRLGIDPKKLR